MAKKKAAKKTAKKASKKTATVKLPASAMTKAAARVFAELAFAVGQGVEQGLSTRPYALSPAAVKYWLDRHAKSIPRALKKKGANFNRDRQGVLLMARFLGRKAAGLALAAAAPTGPVVVEKVHVEAASTAVAADPRCVAAMGGPGGAGEYCAL